MTLLLTPDYFAKNTCLFKDNFLHEIPIDIQKVIMGEVDELDKQELERKEDLEEQINIDLRLGDEAKDIHAHSISNILWELKWRIGDDDEDKYNDILRAIIDEECNNEGFGRMGRAEQLVIAVDWVGVIDLLKQLKREYDIDIDDYSNTELYTKCYYQYLYVHFTSYYNCDDIKIIQKFNLEVLID